MQPQMSCSHDQLMELIRLRNAINSRKEECSELESKISTILSQKSGDTTLSEKLQQLEELQLKRIELQTQKQTLLKSNDELKVYIEGESQKLLNSVERMENVQKKEMKDVLESSVVVLEIAEGLEKQHEELQNKVKRLKKELITQLKTIYSLNKRPNEKHLQPVLLLNGIVIPNKVTSQELELMNEIYGDIAHVIHLLARYFDVCFKHTHNNINRYH